MPIRISELNKKVQHNLTPPDDAIMTGEVHVDTAGDRYPVYREVVTITGRKQMRDAEGQVLYHLRPDGSKHRPMMESYVMEEKIRDFTIVPVGNGISQKNYNFRPQEGELEARKRLKDNQEGLGELSKLLAEQGKTFGDLVSALKGAITAPAAQAPAPATIPPPASVPAAGAGDQGAEGNDKPEFPKSKGFGKFELSDGSEVKGKQEALEAQALLNANAQ